MLQVNENIIVHRVNEEFDGNLIIRTFSINDSMIKQFHLKGWPQFSNKPSNPQIIIELMEKVEQWQLQWSHNSLIVQCL